jgi:putative FmdB family regulatory protein
VPIYEYICDDCQTGFEKIVINKQQEIACAGKNNKIQLSVFATTNGSSSNGGPAPSSFGGGGGGCCGGGCGCH